jgi:stage V sporulation protein B
LTKQGFLYGTLILAGAGLITKILGFVYRIALSRMIGDDGMGLFQMTYPILLFVIVITTAGLPVAISKLVSEAIACKQPERIRSILWVSICTLLTTSVVMTILILLFAPVIANTLLTDSRALYCLLAMIPMIPIIAISSVFRGYFQGLQQMNPYAISQILEQIVRIGTVLILAQLLLPYGIEYAAAGAMIGMVIGEGMGMIYMIICFRREQTKQADHHRPAPSKKYPFATTFREIIRIALPVTASRMVGTFSYALEPIIVAQSLSLAGIATTTATALYGQLEGMAAPLVFFPSFITFALSVSLVPAISEAAAQKNYELIEHRLSQSIRLSLIIGLPCAVVIYLLAEPISLLLYNQVEVAHFIRLMSPFAIFLYLQGPLASALQGLDYAGVSMRNSIIGAVIKTALIFLLAAQPNLGIDGVAIAMNCGIVVVTILHFLSLVPLVPITLHLRDLAKLLFILVVIGLLTHTLLSYEQWGTWLRMGLSMSFSLVAYVVLLFAFSLLSREDLRNLPLIGKWL